MGFLVIGESLIHLYRVPLGTQWLFLAFLTLISGSVSVELPRSEISISISEAFVFTAVLLYGPAAGTITVALDGLVISFWIAKRRPEVYRALFNIAAPALSAWCSARLFFYVSGIEPLADRPASLDEILPALVLFAVSYFGLNSWLIASMIAFQRRANPFQIWRRGFVWLSLNYFCGASVAVLLVGYNRSIDLKFVGLVVPLLLVLYFTFKTSMQRVEDANKHLDQLNTLYLSTIETLAMAIDAKDQVTHGHIRRVQAYAVGLAKRVGVADEKLIKAIEAAALLHDMGKLAVPEHILNKPGKLTAGEYEKMKLHAKVGADILSAIDFPYPVVPIVRHHHENWDGSGYPDGLKGTEIPIGARILSVVDCFDALTSDRPYRPSLSDDIAMQILMQRRGNMYDPLIVDTFALVHQDIAPKGLPPGPPRDALNQIASARRAATLPIRFARPTANSPVVNKTLTARPVPVAFVGASNTHHVGDALDHLRVLIPFSLCVLYMHDTVTGELEAVHVIGDDWPFLKGSRIPIGQRLSGWVAANRRIIVNSDPVLDLGDVARSHAPLLSCLSAPVVLHDRLMGVLTLHSDVVDGFSDEHRGVIEVIAERVGEMFKPVELGHRSSR